MQLCACNLLTVRSPPEHKQQYQYLEHSVRYQGETLILISKWYTGSVSHWREIEAINELKARHIKIGDIVRIPEELVKNKEPLPEQLVLRFSEKLKTIGQSRIPETKQANEVPDSSILEDTVRAEDTVQRAEDSVQQAEDSVQPAEESSINLEDPTLEKLPKEEDLPENQDVLIEKLLRN